MLRVFVLIITIFAFNSYSLTTEERRERIIELLDEEEREIDSLIRATGTRDGEKLLRIAEINLEKARLIKEKENFEYLSLSQEKRRKINKSRFFNKSKRYFDKARAYCVEITKKYPNYKYVSDAYYIIAFDEKETGSLKRSSRYFAKALRKARTKKSKVRTQIALAEVYYNEKNYRKAVPLYEKALSQYKDRWWTKDSFNLAWSYFRTNKFSKAISKMQQVYSASKSNKYVDMRDQVERDIGLFYAVSGRVNEGIRFYKKIGKDFVKRLIGIAQALKTEAQLARALEVLSIAEKYEKDPKSLANIYIEQLVIGENYGKTSDHLDAATKLLALHKKGMTNDYHFEKLKFQSGVMAAKLQKIAAGKQYRRLPKKRAQKAYYANKYFQILVDLKIKPDENTFYQGETSFLIKDYANAYSSYEKAFDIAKDNGNRKVQAQALDGMLAILASKRVKRSFKDARYEAAYLNYLSFDSKSDKADKIYQKLFQVYLDKNQFEKMEDVLQKYQSQFPQSRSIHEAFISNYIDRARKLKRYKLIRFMVSDIQNGKYKVSPKFRTSTENLLTSIQIESVQKDMDRGNKKKALVGYHHILDDKNATNEAKINAMYNIATLYYDLGDSGKTYEWAMKSIEGLGIKKAHQYATSFMAMTNLLIGKQEFGQAINLTMKLLAVECSHRSKVKDAAFKNTAYLLMANEKLDNLQQLIIQTEKCNLKRSIKNEINLALINHYIAKKRPRSAENALERSEREIKDYSELIVASDRIEKLYLAEGNKEKASYLKSKKYYYFKKARKKTLILSLWMPL
jgi:tetratricopeptide (TPR) repeat protein